MEKWLRYTVLPVGQGAGALAQVWKGSKQFDESSGEPIMTALIDLGSHGGWGATAGAASTRFVIAQLKKMTLPRLDAVFLSHSDSDHTDLLQEVCKEFGSPTGPVGTKPVLNVGKVWFGGNKEDYEKKTSDPLNLLIGYCATIESLGDGASSWAKPGGPLPSGPLHRMDDVQFWLYLGNTQAVDVAAYANAVTGNKRKRSDSITRNVVSLVIGVFYGAPTTRRLIATGDATGLTLSKVNDAIKERSIPLAPVLTLSLPHHGSETTTYNATSAKRRRKDSVTSKAEEVVKDFVSNMQPQSITASAAENHSYFHPAARVIAGFAEPVGDRMYQEKDLSGQHFLTPHYNQSELDRVGTNTGNQQAPAKWPPAEGWHTSRTKRNVFTTAYARSDPRGLLGSGIPEISYAPEGLRATFNKVTLPAANLLPPEAAGWGYYVSSDGGKTELRRLVDVAVVKAEALAALEAVHGPLPPERFVFLPSVAEPTSPPDPPPPAVVLEVPRTRAPAGSTRPPRQLP